jgi:uncharacterized protein with gpF-like domain
MKRLMKQVDHLKNDSAKHTLKLLEEARRNVLIELQSAAPDTWDAYYLPRLKAAVERAIGSFARKYNIDLQGRQTELWGLGQEFIDSPLNTMGISVQVPELNLTALEIAQAGTADLVNKGLAADLISKINTEIQLGILGQKSPFEIMQAIGKNLKDPGPFKSIARRAETITRTELARVQNMASSKRLAQIKQTVPEMMHQWLWSGNPNGRPEHMVVHGQVRKVGEPFDVGGEKLMYPGDPAGSAANVINCGCSEAPYMPGWPSLEELAKAA